MKGTSRVVLVSGMHGLGDNVYQRPLLRALVKRSREVFLETPWPQLYSDIAGLRFIRPWSTLRVQGENEDTFTEWTRRPDSYDKHFHIHYGPQHLANGSIVAGMESAIQLLDEPLVIDLPARLARPPVIRGVDRPIAIIRPPTVRNEWANESRNPDPAYVNEAARQLMETHLVISLAYLSPGEEWLVGDPTPAHVTLHDGQLDMFQTIELLRRADVAVGGVGWLAPVAIALRLPTLIIHGGNGAHNAKEHVVDPRYPAPWIEFLSPDAFCRCLTRDHECDKRISDAGDKIRVALRRLAKC